MNQPIIIKFIKKYSSGLLVVSNMNEYVTIIILGYYCLLSAGMPRAGMPPPPPGVGMDRKRPPSQEIRTPHQIKALVIFF